MKNFLIIGICLSLVGCTTATSIKQEKPFVEPQYGMTKLQLVGLLGRPQGIEIYKKPDQTRMEFYIYAGTSGTPQDKVPVCLIDQKVVGWGKTFYEDHISTDDTRIK